MIVEMIQKQPTPFLATFSLRFSSIKNHSQSLQGKRHEKSRITKSLKAITVLERNECYFKSKFMHECLGPSLFYKGKHKVTHTHRSYPHEGHVEISNHGITVLSVSDWLNHYLSPEICPRVCSCFAVLCGLIYDGEEAVSSVNRSCELMRYKN